MRICIYSYTVALVFEASYFLFNFDLRSGYYHVDIHPEHFKYLGFQWAEQDVPRYYDFTILPFGLSTACYLLTKLIRLLLQHWQGKGLKAIVYLDDGIVAANGEQAAIQENA